MELVHGTLKASKIAPEDVISSMPENVITNIMDRLPIQDAVRTGILSRSWRFKWTLLSKLVFDENFFKYLRGSGGGIKHFDKTHISRLLLHLKGAIRKFVLYISDDMIFDVEDINHWVMFLARNGIEVFTLTNMQANPLNMPTHLFSCQQLKHLKLRNCCLQPPPSFRGFPNLLGLKLCLGRSSDHKYGKLISQCTLLKFLRIHDLKPRSEIKLDEIAQLKNLKCLTLSLCLLDNMAMIRCSSVIQTMSLLPKLHHLDLEFEKCKFLAEDGAQTQVSTTFPRLKCLALCKMDFSSDAMLSLASGIIFGSPNLLTVYISATYKNQIAIPPAALGFLELHCSTMRKLQLRTIVLDCIRGSDNEVCLIKSILACSPLLQEVIIRSLRLDGSDEKFNIASKLLKLHRASPTAEIVII